MYGGLAGTLGTERPEGYRGHWGLLGDVGGCLGVSGVYLG